MDKVKALELARHMTSARAIARKGLCLGWKDVLRDLGKIDEDAAFALHLRAGASERFEIDRLCQRARAARKFK